jgi:hypothetical protein
MDKISGIHNDLPLPIIKSDGAAEIGETPDDSMLDQVRIQVECQDFPPNDLLSLKLVKKWPEKPPVMFEVKQTDSDMQATPSYRISSEQILNEWIYEFGGNIREEKYSAVGTTI